MKVRSKAISNQIDNVIGAMNFASSQSDSGNPKRRKSLIPPGVAEHSGRAGVPVFSVSLNSQLLRRNKEINSIPLYFVLLYELYAQVLQRLSNHSLQFALAALKANTRPRTEASILSDRGLTHKRFITPQASLRNVSLKSFTLTLVGAIERTHRSAALKNNATRFARVSDAGDAGFVIARSRAMYSRLAANIAFRRKRNATLWAGLCGRAIARSLVTGATAKPNYPVRTRARAKTATAVPADQILKTRASFSVLARHVEADILPRFVGPTGGFCSAN